MVDELPRTTRRTALKGIGAALGLAGASLASGSAAAASPEYDVRTITDGLTRIDVHEEYGGRLENVAFDQREPGAMAEIVANGGEFAIRNVAFVGAADAPGNRKQIRPSVRDASGTGIIENVYMADGAASPGNDVMGIYVEAAHAGTLEIRDVNICGYSDNGMYCSDPGYYDDSVLNPAHGEVHIEGCYGHNNNIAQFRIGSAGSYVRDSVAIVDDPGTFPANANGLKNARGVWFRNTPDVTAERCQIYQTEEWGACEAADGGEGTVRSSRVRGAIQDGIRTNDVQPLGRRPSPPSGVPRTAFEAVAPDSA